MRKETSIIAHTKQPQKKKQALQEKGGEYNIVTRSNTNSFHGKEQILKLRYLKKKKLQYIIISIR